MLAFQTDFCAEFGKYGADGASLTQSGWGANNIAPDATAIYTNCPSISATAPATTACGNGATASARAAGTARGPCARARSSSRRSTSTRSRRGSRTGSRALKIALAVMRHPNTGCQWGDHSPDIRASFFSDPVPEMCLWEVRSKRRRGGGCACRVRTLLSSLARAKSPVARELPCNDPGFGCEEGMCGTVDGTYDHQHAADCVLQIDDDEAAGGTAQGAGAAPLVTAPVVS